MSLYSVINWYFFITCSLLLGFIFQSRRYYFIKPSILLITFSIIFFQFPLAIYSGTYEVAVPDPYILSFLIHGYILIGLTVSLYTFQDASRTVWKRITEDEVKEPLMNTYAVVMLAGTVIFIGAIYLVHVPFRESGLYAVFANPAMAVVARERSLKLLDSQALVYAFSLMTSSVAPMLAVMLSLIGAHLFFERRFFSLTVILLTVISLMIVVSLPGARVSAVNLLLAVCISFFLVKGLPFHPARLFLLLILIVTPGVLIGMYRDGKAFGIDLYQQYLWDFIGRRILQDPLEVGSWYIHHAQTYGFFGIPALPKLAAIAGFDALNVPNYIGLRYQPNAGPTVSAGAGYLLTYYSYFGVASLLVSLIGLWLLDLAVSVYKSLSRAFLIPCVSAVSLSTLSFISSDYSTVLITHGFAVTLILALSVDTATAGKRYNRV
jgi:hypothetical protein